MVVIQSILKEISPGCSVEGLMLKLKLQYFGHLMWRAESFEKTLMLGKIEGRRRRDNRGWDGWMASPTQWTWVWVNSGSWWWIGKPGVLQSMGLQRVRHDWVTERQHKFWIILSCFTHTKASGNFIEVSFNLYINLRMIYFDNIEFPKSLAKYISLHSVRSWISLRCFAHL